MKSANYVKTIRHIDLFQTMKFKQYGYPFISLLDFHRFKKYRNHNKKKTLTNSSDRPNSITEDKKDSNVVHLENGQLK